jgi:hypothetical protein
MPNAISRPSLTTTLADRYATQPVGGAFNARNIIESGVDALFASNQSAEFQVKNGFLTEELLQVSDFKNEGNGLSQYVQGLDTSKYDAAVH